MDPLVLLSLYCMAILAVSVLGGMIPRWLRLTHRWMECAVSMVAGVMLGIGLLHMLPHALALAVQGATSPAAYLPPLQWALWGWLAMFFVERFFCFHHHDLPDDHHDHDHAGPIACEEHGHVHSDHAHDLSWGGAAFGLTLHSVLAGVALAASVFHGDQSARLAGLGVFLAIVLHKPFDSMTIAMLMQRGGRSPVAQGAANSAFALAVPLGAWLFYFGAMTGHESNAPAVSAALAFSAGMFLCISMSDLLPELQFHHHDRWKLSLSLLLGLAIAWGASKFEGHVHAKPPQAVQQSEVLE